MVTTAGGALWAPAKLEVIAMAKTRARNGLMLITRVLFIREFLSPKFGGLTTSLTAISPVLASGKWRC
jgi:acetyl-CoA carboxylase beta subunit